jgi:hypothetical protein
MSVKRIEKKGSLGSRTVKIEVTSAGSLAVAPTDLYTSRDYQRRLRDVNELFELARAGQVNNVDPNSKRSSK